MILQKIASAIRRQDWFQVTIEILIVIIGIFLGLQVQASYEARAERQLELAYIERLLKDADNSILVQQATLEDMTSRIDKFQRLLDMLEDNMISDDNLDEFSKIYLETFGWRAIQYYQETMNELISSGTLSVIRSTDFRTKISSFRDSIRLVDNSTRIFGQNIQSARQNLYKIVKMDRNREKIILSPSELHENDTIYNLINANALYVNSMRAFSIEFHNETKKFRDEIVAELERLQ